jgi:transglutaminase-like putative cysteine protease
VKKETDLRWDYALSAFASCLAVYSTSMGLINAQMGLLFVAAVILGNLFSAMIQARFAGKRILNVAGVLYTGTAFAALFWARSLNGLLPGEGLPTDTFAGHLCWMLVFGSFVAWTESVLLFQAVPSIALLGMVGTWDTFPGAPFAFFGLLICTAGLMSRAHGRDMLRQARESGFTSISQIHDGPWKRMAGPQWALSSAAVIVLISLVGAPLIQSSMAAVAGNVKVQLPAAIIRAQNRPGGLDNRNESSARVGAGPIIPGEAVMLAVGLDQPRYLRDNMYDQYTGHGWVRSSSVYLPGDRVWQEGRSFRRASFALTTLKNPKRINYSIEVVSGAFDVLPGPGEVTKIAFPEDYQPSNLALTRRAPGTTIFKGEALVPQDGAKPVEAYRDLPRPYGDTLTEYSSTQRVADFANEVAAGKRTDFEKALAIQMAIGQTAEYDLSAPAVPAEADAVDYFLFEGKRGYCDLFASSMVTMARAVGIPARYVTGFYPFSGDKDESGRYLVKASERHAWAELFFKDFGWVPFDATEGAMEAEGYGRGSSGIGVAFFKKPWVAATLDCLIVLAAFGAVFFIVRAQRIGKAAQVAKGPDAVAMRGVRNESTSKIGRLYAGLVKDVERQAGVRKHPALTPREFLDQVRTSLAGADEPVRVATDAYVESLYSGRTVGPDDVLAFAAEIKAARIAVRANSKPLWRLVPSWIGAKVREAVVGVRTIVHLRREERRA